MLPRLAAKLGITWDTTRRLIGAGMILYGMLFDHSDDRGTIILAGVGFLGYEFVQKAEKGPKKDDTRA